MKFGIVGALNEGLVRGTREPIRQRISARAIIEADTSPGDICDTHEARHSLTVWFTQRVTKAEWDNEDFRIQLRRRAAQAIARHVTSGLDEKLSAAMEALWEDGFFDHPAAKILEEIQKAVRTGE